MDDVVTEAMVEAALSTEFEGRSLRGVVNAQLWHSGAYGNAKAFVRASIEAALKAKVASKTVYGLNAV